MRCVPFYASERQHSNHFRRFHKPRRHFLLKGKKTTIVCQDATALYLNDKLRYMHVKYGQGVINQWKLVWNLLSQALFTVENIAVTAIIRTDLMKWLAGTLVVIRSLNTYLNFICAIAASRERSNAITQIHVRPQKLLDERENPISG